MAVAARAFGRRPRDDQGAANTAASLGAVLELLRALNWMIRADVPWPTRRGQSFDFVLVGEPGVFALWVTDGDPEGVEDAAEGLSSHLGGSRVRAIVCRSSASLASAHPEVMFCTPETALDLLIGLPPHAIPEEIRTATTLLRDLEVPVPPEPEPEPEPAPEPEPVSKSEPAQPTARPVGSPTASPARPPVVAPPPVEKPTLIKSAVTKAQAPPVKVATTVDPPKVPAPKASKASKAIVPEADLPKATLPKNEARKAATPKTVATPAPATPPAGLPIGAAASAAAPVPTLKPLAEEGPPATQEISATPKADPARPLPAGRHRSERPRRALTPRRTPPAPPDGSEPVEPTSTLVLPTALVPPPGRIRGGDNAGQRFDNSYVYVPEPLAGPGPLKREFRAKAFIKGVVAIVVVILAAGVAVKAWPQVAGLIHSDPNPSAVFGRAITVDGTDYHPKLTLTTSVPHSVGSAKGLTSYAVDFRVSNVGSASWRLPARSAFVLVDSLGESHLPSSISGASRSGWSGSLRPARSWSGRFTVTIASNRTLLRFRFVLASDGSESATWVEP